MFIFSREHDEFIRKQKKEKRVVIFFQIVICICFLIFWESLVHFSIINPFLFSSPSKILDTIISLIKSGELFQHIFITGWEVFLSFSLSTILGIFIASLLWRFKILSKILDPYIVIINSLPKVALGPLIIIWIGANIHSIIFMALTISLFTTIITVYNGFISVDKKYILLLKSFGANNYQIYKKVIFPSNLSLIFSTLKINVSLSLIGVIMGELLVSKCGLGFLIMYGSQVFQLDLVISSVFILGVVSYLMYLVIDIVWIFLQRNKK